MHSDIQASNKIACHTEGKGNMKKYIYFLIFGYNQCISVEELYLHCRPPAQQRGPWRGAGVGRVLGAESRQ